MEHIAGVSFGKDSMATVILALEHNEPLDAAVYAEVMFDKTISGEVPEHREFIYNTAIPKLKSWGIPTVVLRSEKTFLDCFYHVIAKSKIGWRNGRRQGFPFTGKCKIQDRCKWPPIDRFLREHTGVKRYVGIEADESKRLNRLQKDRDISLLDKYKVPGEQTAEICRAHGLLSPVYEFAPRNGCWFCPNAKDPELRHLRDHHPELWRKLLELQNESNVIRPGKFRINEGLFEIEEMFDNEDRQMCFDDIGRCDLIQGWF